MTLEEAMMRVRLLVVFVVMLIPLAACSSSSEDMALLHR